jgi:hypothetical protein
MTKYFARILLWMLLWNVSLALEAALDMDVDEDSSLEDRIFTKERQVGDSEKAEEASITDDSTSSEPRVVQDTQPLPAQEESHELQERPAGTVEEVHNAAVDHHHDDDEQTYLDLFGEYAKEFLTQKLVPTSDPECQWNWRHGRCEPVCLCDFQPKRGDFHLGRACRRRPTTNMESCVEEDEHASLLRFLPTPMIQHMIQQVKRRSQHVQTRVSAKMDNVMDAVQVQVCRDVKQHCSSDSDKEEKPEDRVYAWQERLFCQDIIDDCSSDEVRSTPNGP